MQRRRIGEVVEKAAHKVVITRTTAQEAIDFEPAHQVLDGFEDPETAHLLLNRFKAIQWVLQNAKSGDAVLIVGCGERPFALVGEDRWTITDRDVCQAWLYDNADIEVERSFPKFSSSQIFNIDDYRN